MENTNLASLAMRVLGGDTQAYEGIFLETKDNIYFHAKTVLLSEEAAWDAVQDSYVAAFRSLEKLQSPDALETWLCAIACNLCFLRLKKQAGGQASALSDPETPLSEAAIRALPDVWRTALVLRYCDGMSAGQIGSIVRAGADKAQEYLSSAEKALGIRRDVSGEGGHTPSELKEKLEELRSGCVLSPALTLSIGGAVARKCGYSSSLRVTSDLSTRTEIVLKPGDKKHADDIKQKASAVRAGEESKWSRKSSNSFPVIAAAALVLLGVALGGYAVHGLVSAKSETSIDNSSAFSASVEPDGTSGGAALSSESAQAYIGVLTGYTGKLGICSSETSGEGLAYARLTDLDGDGENELYLYYIDQSFPEDSKQYAVGETGEALYCLHEELWKWDGELINCYTQEHFYNSAAPTELNSKGRWLYSDEGNERLASWYSNIDENGFTNQYLTLYALSEGTLDTECEASAKFVTANAANQLYDGYIIESDEYYGTENSRFDDIGYFVEGAVKTDERRESYTYEDCLALSDLNTSDIIPIGDWDEESPVAILKNFFDAKKESGVQLIYNNGSTLAWQLSDINTLLSDLADTSIGK